MNLFSNPQYNGRFMGASSAKPIAGIVTNNAYKRNLIEAKVASDSAALTIGGAVIITNSTDDTNAGAGFNPITLKATAATAAAGNGFAVMSQNAVLEDGDKFPKFVASQIIYVAKIGMGVELYLPCDSTLSGATNTIYWDGSKLVSAETAPTDASAFALENIQILSAVVNGAIPTIDSTTGAVSAVDGSVVKVRV